MQKRQHHKTVTGISRPELDLKDVIKNADTMLLDAAAKGEGGRVRSILLHSAADVDARNSKGETALILAAAGGHMDVVQVLKRLHADPFALGPGNLTARERAEKAGHDVVVRALKTYEEQWTLEHQEPEVVHSD